MVNKKLTMQNSNRLFTINLDDFSNFCGIDEAGRGPIAGPLVVAGVILKQSIKGLTDSKKLSEKKRETLFEKIQKNSKYYIHTIEAAQIDEIGLSKALQESLLAIKDFFKVNNYLFDGNNTFGVSGITTMVKADTKIASVSAASILAKVSRDRVMVEYSKIYPNYGFEKHKGYGTKAHLEAISKYGYTQIHRRSFKIKLHNTEQNLL